MQNQAKVVHATWRMLSASVALALCTLPACGDKPTPALQQNPAAAGASTRPGNTRDLDVAKVDEAVFASGIVTTRKACDLMVRADAEAAVGEPLPQNTVLLGLGMCDFNTADFSAGASVTVGAWESIKAAANAGKQVPSPVSGVGDDALNLNGSNGSTLYVRRGTEGFMLTLHGPRIDPLPDHGLEAEKVLAGKVLARF